MRAFRNERIVFEPGFFIMLSIALLIIPVRWIISWFIAVFVHELSHFVALRLCNVSVFQISIDMFGTDIQTDAMSTGQEIVSAIAGPLGSLLLLLFLRVFPYISLCALAQLLFNLIPIYPMDGGRVVTGICVGLLGRRRGVGLSKAVSLTFWVFLLCTSLFISFQYKLGVTPVLIAVLIIARTLKIPCKERQLIVQ